jgi:DNA-binding transcriptional ArsR family regulator
MPDPRRDLKSLERLRAYLETKPRTIEQIETKFDLSRRGAYRWLDYLREDGIAVITQKDVSWYPAVIRFSVTS